MQTKACCAAEKVDAAALPHPWIGSEQGSADSHEDHRFRHFLDHSHPSLDDEILPCHTAVTSDNLLQRWQQPCSNERILDLSQSGRVQVHVGAGAGHQLLSNSAPFGGVLVLANRRGRQGLIHQEWQLWRIDYHQLRD